MFSLQNESNLSETDISIIIVNYKSWEPLTLCLNSILEINQSSFAFETIVVDNYSNDGQLSRFSEKYSSIHFIENSGNNGFSDACNLGAQKAKGKYLFFLNPDTEITKEAITELYTLAVKNANYGIVSCNIINAKGKINKEFKPFPSLLTLFGPTRLIYKLINKKTLKKRFDFSKRIVFPDWVTGSVIFMSKVWFEKVGGWNEDFWMYFEDVDICKKIDNHGGLIALTRDVQIIHRHGGATRINTKTEALTKSEVIISNHVYVSQHFKRYERGISLILLVSGTFISNLFLGLLGGVFFFIPKLRVRYIIFTLLLSYYTKAIKNKTWLSEKSINFKSST